MRTAAAPPKITPWRQTYRQLLRSADVHAAPLRRAIMYLAAAAAVQGLALACIYPLLLAAWARQGSLWLWLAGSTALMIAATALRWAGQGFDYNGHMIATTHALRTRLGAQLRRMPLQILQERRSGEINATLLGNVDENLMYTLTILNAIFVALITPLAAALATLWVDWRLAVCMLLVFPLIVPFYRWRRPAFARGMRALDAAHQRTSADILEYMQGLPVLRAARCAGEKAKTLQEGFAHLQRIQTIGHQKGSKPAILIATATEGGLILIAMMGVWWVTQGSLHIAVWAAALVMMVRFAEPLTNFIWSASMPCWPCSLCRKKRRSRCRSHLPWRLTASAFAMGKATPMRCKTSAPTSPSAA